MSRSLRRVPARWEWVLVPALVAVALIAPATVSGQFLDEKFAPVATIPEPGLYSPEVQQAIEQGYEQLSLVTDPRDEERLTAAKEAFDRALAFEPNSVHALNGRGMYELKKDEGWLVILESIQKLFNRDHISMAIKDFEKSVDIDPEFHPGRYNLALAYRQARGPENFEKAIEHLETLIANDPSFAQAPLVLVLTYRDLGNLDGMEKALNELPESDAFTPAARKLMLAYALFNIGQPTEGAAAYWDGVSAIGTEAEADLYWFDVRAIASPEADNRFRTLDLAGKKQMLVDYWQQLGDQTFVTADERLAEHYRRLHYAFTNYRIQIPERRHYSSINAYVPPWQTGLDDRGVIYMRHGPPDDTATFQGPEVQNNISWKYERADGDHLVFHFVSDEDVSDYKLVRRLADATITNASKMTGQTLLNTQCGQAGGTCDTYDSRILAGDTQALSELYSSRGSIDHMYDRAATFDPLVLEREEASLAADIVIATQSQSYTPEPPESPLIYPVYAVPFKDVGGPVVAFYYALPTEQLSILTPVGGGSEVDYRHQLMVMSGTDTEPIERQQNDVQLASPNPIPVGSGVMIPRVSWASLGPGEYQYGLKLTDLNSGRFGITQGDIAVDDFSAPTLSLSGIVLANRVDPVANSTSSFVRWGRMKVVPQPSRMFKRTQPVYVYYEAYGLVDSGSGARYRTTYTLEARQSDRNVVARFFSAVGDLMSEDDEKGAITYSFERSQADNTDPLLEFISLDVSRSEPGDYNLIVELADLEAGTSASRSIPLTLVKD